MENAVAHGGARRSNMPTRRSVVLIVGDSLLSLVENEVQSSAGYNRIHYRSSNTVVY
jgi:hypothetical protein